jgi:hypothetical protein
MELSIYNSNQYSPSSRSVVAFGLTKPMRVDVHSVDFNNRLSIVLTVACVHYCGAKEESLDSAFIKEVYDFLLQKFGGLGVNEIQEAFRLAAANVIDVDISAYNGRVTIKTIGDVLAKYSRYRDPIKKELMREQELNAMREQEDEQQRKHQEFEQTVLAWWADMPQIKHFNDVPHYFYDTLVNHRKIAGDSVTLSWFTLMAKVYKMTDIKRAMGRTISLDEERVKREELRRVFEGSEKNVIENMGKRMYIYAALWKRRNKAN